MSKTEVNYIYKVVNSTKQLQKKKQDPKDSETSPAGNTEGQSNAKKGEDINKEINPNTVQNVSLIVNREIVAPIIKEKKGCACGKGSCIII